MAKEGKKIDFYKLKKEYENYDSSREKLIIQSRKVLKNAKQLIYSLHRKEGNERVKNEDNLKKEFNKLSSIIEKDKKLLNEGSYKDACEEYAEAMLYSGFKDNDIPTKENLGVSVESYLGGVADLTGELVRRAIVLASKRNFEEVYEIKDFADYVYKEMIKFNFRSGNLRKKFDSIKYNLSKLEDIEYEISMKNQ
ncbi:MAG: translin family protein [Nanobdellota archaeon]